MKIKKCSCCGEKFSEEQIAWLKAGLTIVCSECEGEIYLSEENNGEKKS